MMWDKLESDTCNWLSSALAAEAAELVEQPDLFAHLAGRRRVLGTAFPFFFTAPGELCEETTVLFARLAVACRAMIVVDDALRDGHLFGVSSQQLLAARDVVMDRISALLAKLLGNERMAEQLCVGRVAQLENAYRKRTNADPPTLEFSFDRCALLGLPFDVLRQIVGSGAGAAREADAKLMLYILQLADDYADRFEDDETAENRNLLTWGTARWYLRSDSDAFGNFCCNYASTAIFLLAANLIHGGHLPQIRHWAQQVLHLLSIPNNSRIRDLSEILFAEPLPGGYLIPVSNYNVREVLSLLVLLNPGARSNMTAESLHRATTLSILNKYYKSAQGDS